MMWWDARTWKVRRVVPVLEEVEAAGFIGSGKLSYTGGANGNIRIWQTENGQELTQPQDMKGEADAIVRPYCLFGIPSWINIDQNACTHDDEESWVVRHIVCLNMK